MSQNDTPAADKVTWFELPADDTARASEFYAAVFNWDMSAMGDTGSMYAQTTPSDADTNPLEPGAINGDISPRSEGFDKPTIVITVQDIDAKIGLVEEAGGKLVLPRQDHTEMGIAWALVSDTEGNTIGLLQNL